MCSNDVLAPLVCVFGQLVNGCGDFSISELQQFDIMIDTVSNVDECVQCLQITVCIVL